MDLWVNAKEKGEIKKRYVYVTLNILTLPKENQVTFQDSLLNYRWTKASKTFNIMDLWVNAKGKDTKVVDVI